PAAVRAQPAPGDPGHGGGRTASSGLEAARRPGPAGLDPSLLRAVVPDVPRPGQTGGLRRAPGAGGRGVAPGRGAPASERVNHTREGFGMATILSERPE